MEKATQLRFPEPEPTPDTPVVVVFIVRQIDDQLHILLAKRIQEPHAGEYTLPGGKTIPGETPEETAIREVREETGLDILDQELLIPASPAPHPRLIDGKPYSIRTYFTFFDEIGNGTEPKSLEPDKLTPWEWIPFNQVKKLFVTGLVPKLIIDDWWEEIAQESFDIERLPSMPEIRNKWPLPSSILEE